VVILDVSFRDTVFVIFISAYLFIYLFIFIFCQPVPGSRSAVGTIEKVGVGRAGSGKKKSRPLFRSPLLTERLEQANFLLVFKATRCPSRFVLNH